MVREKLPGGAVPLQRGVVAPTGFCEDANQCGDRVLKQICVLADTAEHFRDVLWLEPSNGKVQR